MSTSSAAGRSALEAPPLPDLPRITDYTAYWARLDADREMLTHAETRLTRSEVEEQSATLARAFLAAGVQRGDRVAVLGNPRPEFYVTFLAAARIGAIWQGLNPKYTAGELDHVVGDSQPKVLMGLSANHRDTLEGVLERVGSDSPVITAGESWEAFLSAGEAVSAEVLRDAESAVDSTDPAVLVYTSGTSGRPKGALLPHRGLVQCSVVQADRWYEAQPRMLCDLPINHVGCLGDISSSVVVAGGTVHYMEKFDRSGVLDVIARERLEYWLAIPTMFLLVTGTPEWATADLSSMKRAIWGGAAASRELILELQSRIPLVCTSFGMTETVGSIIYTDDDDDLDALANTVGRPDPRFEIRIARTDGIPCDTDEEGEIQARGPFLMLGYLNRPEATAAAIDADGWFHTGDVGRIDRDGRIRLAGRLSDMFKSGGYNVYPREIELALEEHPQVRSAAVVSIADALYSEVGVGFVIPQPGAELDTDELRSFLRTRLANYKIPKRLEVREEFPRLAIGKVDKRVLKQWAAILSQ
ncbi:class I adenylate-forming enzyme family protein [Mycolicibacterium komossense]|uniref:AMP-binding protein n=1 Tax=Mycolicibacterium komossense TaxID=1779 RepID=A0ABT3CFI8_9MYCO|nr:AMP-binding protein [Mycolicibacterium komossense]MCV7228138.1 AMP-binding protein [Mycolicibacterium komossense]